MPTSELNDVPQLVGSVHDVSVVAVVDDPYGPVELDPPMGAVSEVSTALDDDDDGMTVMTLVVPMVMTVVNSSLVVELRTGRVDSSVVPGLV